MSIENKDISGIYNVGSQNGYTINDIIKFYFGENALKSAKVFDKKNIKSQTLSIVKIKKVLKLKKDEFHEETKNQLLKCKKFFF